MHAGRSATPSTMEQFVFSPPAIKTERLHMRHLGLVDAEAFRAMTDETAIIEAIHFLERPFTLANAETLIGNNHDGRDRFWGVWMPGEPALLGTVGTHLRDSEKIEIGYWFATAAQGRGFASEAVRGVIGALVRAYPKNLIVAECRPENVASWRLLERIGFRADGTDGARPGRKRFVFAPNQDAK
jgi:RimJ/RimL family protein N-acetyltransferase